MLQKLCGQNERAFGIFLLGEVFDAGPDGEFAELSWWDAGGLGEVLRKVAVVFGVSRLRRDFFEYEEITGEVPRASAVWNVVCQGEETDGSLHGCVAGPHMALCD